MTVLLCLLFGSLLALLGSFVPELFSEFMKVAKTNARWGLAGWLVFFYIGIFAVALFFVGHAFKVLNERVAVLVKDYFKFLDWDVLSTTHNKTLMSVAGAPSDTRFVEQFALRFASFLQIAQQIMRRIVWR